MHWLWWLKDFSKAPLLESQSIIIAFSYPAIKKLLYWAKAVTGPTSISWGFKTMINWLSLNIAISDKVDPINSKGNPSIIQGWPFIDFPRRGLESTF